jgi:hypothetical protein
LLKVQNSWAKKAGQLQEQIATAEKSLEDRTARLRDLQAQIDRETIVWDRYWSDVRATVGQNGQIMTENLGRNQGLGGFDAENRPAPLVHLFGQTPDGGSVYAGTFIAAELREQQTLLQPTHFLMHPPQQLAQFTLWRVRSTVPQSDRDRVTELHDLWVSAHRLLADKQRHLATQDQIIADSQKVRDLRLTELNGDANSQQIGLVAQLRETETERDGQLVELDRLRREAHGVYQQIVSLVEQNDYLTRALPGGQQVVSQQTER